MYIIMTSVINHGDFRAFSFDRYCVDAASRKAGPEGRAHTLTVPRIRRHVKSYYYYKYIYHTVVCICFFFLYTYIYIYYIYVFVSVYINVYLCAWYNIITSTQSTRLVFSVVRWDTHRVGDDRTKETPRTPKTDFYITALDQQQLAVNQQRWGAQYTRIII